MSVCAHDACARIPACVHVTVCDTQSANETCLSDEWHCKH